MKTSIFDSLWNPTFYQNNSDTFSFGKGLLRLLLVNFFIGCLVSALFYLSVGRQIPAQVASFVVEAVEEYPSNLVVTIKDGVLTKNIPGVIRLYPLDSLHKNDIQSGNQKNVPHFMFMIDDTQEASLAAYTASDAIMFFGKDGMVSKSNNDIRVQSYKNLEGVKKDLSFSKETLTYLTTFVTRYVKYLPGALFVLMVLAYTLFAPLFGMASSLFFGFVTMLLSAYLLGRKRTYGESYILSMYALPSVLLVEMIVNYIPRVSSITSMIPFFTTFLIVIFLWLMFRQSSSKEAQATHDTL